MGFKKRNAIQKAITLTQQGQHDKAIAEYEAILRVDPSDLSIYNTLGDLYAHVRSIQKAIAYYQKLVDMLRAEGLHFRAIAVYKKIIKLDAGNLPAWIGCADLYAQEGLRAEAKHHYLLAIERALRLGFDKQALDAYQRLMLLEPGEAGRAAKLASLIVAGESRSEAADLLNRLAQDVRALGKHDDARLLYKQVVEIAPKRFTGWYGLGRVEFEAGRLQEAEEPLRRAAKIDVNSPLPYLLLGQLYEQQGKPDLAKAAWQALLRCDPKHREPRRHLGLLYLNEGDTEAAVKEFDDAARSLSESGELERAIALFGELGPSADHSLVQERLGELFERSGRSAEAKAAFTRAAEIHLAAGRAEERARVLRRLRALHPQDFSAVAESPPAGALASQEGAGGPGEEALRILGEPEHKGQTILVARGQWAEEAPAPLAVIDAYLEQGNEAKARALLRRLIAGEPGNVEAVRRLESLEIKVFAEDAAVAPEIEVLQPDHLGGLVPWGSAPGSLASPVERVQVGPDLGPSADRSQESCEAHYQLAAAYREMGLLDDAIAEFRRAAANEQLTLRACDMVGLCLLAKGDAEAAIHELLRGLSVVGRPPEEYHAIKYDLATAYQTIGDMNIAVAILRDLQGESPSYRDAKARVQELEGRLAQAGGLSGSSEGSVNAAPRTQSG